MSTPVESTSDEVTVTVRTLLHLIEKGRQAGWEQGSGLITDEYVRDYLHRVVTEHVGLDVARLM